MSDESILNAIEFVANTAHGKYARWVDRDDLRQELAVYAYGNGRKQLDKWAESGETFRINRALFGVAKGYGENEKAVKSGYEFGDIAWYAPEHLKDLVPLALDHTFDGLVGDGERVGDRMPGRGGETLLAMIADTRKALSANPDAYNVVAHMSEESDEYHTALVALADYLGGEFPQAPGYERGRRKVMSNAAAIAATGNEY